MFSQTRILEHAHVRCIRFGAVGSVLLRFGRSCAKRACVDSLAHGVEPAGPNDPPARGHEGTGVPTGW
eukprot:13496045-Alexandrium_andersonii.AAC.1